VFSWVRPDTMIECYRERTEVLKDDIAAKVDISLMDPDVVEQ